MVEEPLGRPERHFQSWGMRGVALVPSRLRREWSGRPVPAQLAHTLGARGVCWDELDVAIWEGLQVDPARLATAVAAAVDGALISRERRRLGPMPILDRAWLEGLELRAVPLRTRTQRVITELTQGPAPVSPDRLTMSDLLDTPGAGVITMLDFACTAEAALAAHEERGTGGRATPDTDPELALLLSEPWARGVAGDDPRFRDLLGAVWRGSVVDLVAVGSEPAKVDLRALLPDLRGRVTAVGAMPLEEALSDYVQGLMGLGPTEPQLQAVLARLGLRGDPPTRLQGAGDLAGLTRERVRQLEAKAIERRNGSACPVPYFPQLDSALSRVAEALPLPGREISALLLRDGITGRAFAMESLSAAAAFLGREVPYVVVGSGRQAVLVPHSSPLLPEHAAAIRAAARNQVAKSGASNCMAVARELGEVAESLDYELLVLVVTTSDGVVMGDAGWFWFVDEESVNSSFTKVSLGMLAVTTPLSTRSLLAGLRRRGTFRRLPDVPPAHVLEKVYTTHPAFIVVEDEWVWPAEDVGPEAVLGDLDRSVLAILREAPDQILDRAQLLAECRKSGLNVSSVHRYLTYSPSVEEVGEERYAPRGANRPAGVVALRPVPAIEAREDRKVGIAGAGAETSPTSGRTARPSRRQRRLQPAALGRPLAEIFPELPPAVSPFVHLVHTAGRMEELFEQLWNAVQHEVHAFSRPPYSSRPGVVLPAVVEALARGVAARAVYEAPEVSDPALRSFREEVESYVDAGVQARMVDRLPMKLVVFDRHVTLVALAGETVDVGYPTNLFIDHAGFAEVQVNAFERQWEAAGSYARPKSSRRRATRREQRGGA